MPAEMEVLSWEIKVTHVHYRICTYTTTELSRSHHIMDAILISFRLHIWGIGRVCSKWHCTVVVPIVF